MNEHVRTSASTPSERSVVQVLPKASLVRSIGQWLYRRVYTQVVPNGNAEIKRLLADSTSILDVGCGENSPIRYLPTTGKQKIGIDVYAPALVAAQQRGYHDEYRRVDALDIEKEFGPKSFDCVFAFDLIEHLPKEDSSRLIETMERVARKAVIVNTPNGYVPWTPTSGNPFQAHQCGWSVEEMRARGYTVLGTCGWRRLRNRHNWFGPFRDDRLLHFQLFCFDTTQVFVKTRPELAFNLLCLKAMASDA